LLTIVAEALDESVVYSGHDILESLRVKPVPDGKLILLVEAREHKVIRAILRQKLLQEGQNLRCGLEQVVKNPEHVNKALRVEERKATSSSS